MDNKKFKKFKKKVSTSKTMKPGDAIRKSGLSGKASMKKIGIMGLV